jgi:hypothetical protein
MFIKTQAPSPVGSLLDFEFQLGDGFQLIKGTGEVVWIRSDEQGPGKPAGMGLRFLRLSKGSRELIYKIVDEFIHQGGEPFDLEAGHAPGPGPLAARAAAPAVPAAQAAAAVPAPPTFREITSPQPDPALSSLSLPALAARTFGGAGTSPAPPPPAPLPEMPVPLGAYAAAAAAPRAGWSPSRLAMIVVAAVVVGLGAAAFVFQDALMTRAGLLGREGGEAAGGPAAGADGPAAGATTPAGGGEEPTADAGGRPDASGGRAAAPASASVDAIPEPAGPGSIAAREERAVAGAGRARAPAGPAASRRQPAVAAAPLTAIRSITWRVAGGDTELTVRGDGPIRAGAYTRTRLEGGSPRELIRIRGIRGPYSPAQVPVGSSQLKQVRTGHHVVPGGQELHLVLDLADSRVVVRGIQEVDGALVVRLGGS